VIERFILLRLSVAAAAPTNIRQPIRGVQAWQER
jgi:hypothetical protein